MSVAPRHPGGNPGRPGPLLPQHLDDLRESGLTADDARAAGLYSESDPVAVGRLLKWSGPARALGACLVFPYLDPDGRPTGYARVKPITPRVDRKSRGKVVKYEAPKGEPNRLYVPPGTRTVLADPAVPLLVTEGEKKALAADKAGFACVGLAGVWAWQIRRPRGADGKAAGSRNLIPDLAAVVWTGRRVNVVFDSDAARNQKVRAAERALVAALVAAGADVQVVRLPDGTGGAKVGLDDLLVAHAPDALRTLLAASVPATAGRDASDPGGDRIRIEVTPRQHLTNDAVLRELPRLPDLYQRGDMLVRVSRQEGETTEAVGNTEVTRPAGQVVQVYDACSLGGDLTRFIDFVRVRVTDGGITETPAHPPGWATNYVIRRKHWPGVPELVAVVTYPVILPDGRVVAAAGYDRASGVYLDGDFSALAVPDRPTRGHAERAAADLADLVGEFEWEQDAHQAAWVMATLTPLARHAYPGSTPLFLYEANTPGAGKTLLTDVTAEIVAGRPFPKCSYPTGDPREVDKLLTAFAVAGDSVFLFDNVAGRFGDPYLDKVLTGTEYQGRILGESRTWKGHFAPVVYATGNNAELVHDLPRRVVPVKLFTDEEFPDARDGFRYELPAHARENRPRYLSAALTVLKAYILAGRPAVDGVRPFGSFDGWAGLVRNAVVWAGLADISEAREQTRREADRDRPLFTTLLTELRQRFPDGGAFTLRQVVKAALTDEAAGWSTVGEVLTALGATDAPKLSYHVRRIRGRNFGGLRIDHYHAPGDERRTRSGVKWAVETCVRAIAGGRTHPSSPSAHRYPAGPAAAGNGAASSPHRHPASTQHNGSTAKPFDNPCIEAGDDGADGSQPCGPVSAAGVGGGDDAEGTHPRGDWTTLFPDQMLPD